MAELNPLIGHTAQRRAIARLFTKGKLPSTMLFAGPPGIGKRLVAVEVARSLLCEAGKGYGGCGECRMCTLLAAANLPDFYLAECADRECWGAEQIKELLYSLNLSSCYQRGRVIVLNDVEALHTASLNSLLKALEEPRPNTWFILVSANPGKLPPTIVSRAQAWHFNALAPEEVRSILETQNEETSGIALDELIILADGAPGSISGIREHAGEWEDLKLSMAAIHGGDAARAMSLAGELAKDKEALPDRIKLLRIYARHRMHANPDDSAWALCLSNLISAERFIFERNINAQYVLTQIFLTLCPSATPPAFTTLTNSAKLIDRLVV